MMRRFVVVALAENLSHNGARSIAQAVDECVKHREPTFNTSTFHRNAPTTNLLIISKEARLLLTAQNFLCQRVRSLRRLATLYNIPTHLLARADYLLAKLFGLLPPTLTVVQIHQIAHAHVSVRVFAAENPHS